MAICCTLSWQQKDFDLKVLGLTSFLREPSEMMETFVLSSGSIQGVKKYVWKYIVRMICNCLFDILLILNLGSKGSAVPSTNVARLPCVGWVCCWLSLLLWEVFRRVRGILLPLKTDISKFQFDQESGRRRTTLWMCYLQIVIYFHLFIILFHAAGRW